MCIIGSDKSCSWARALLGLQCQWRLESNQKLGKVCLEIIIRALEAVLTTKPGPPLRSKNQGRGCLAKLSQK